MDAYQKFPQTIRYVYLETSPGLCGWQRFAEYSRTDPSDQKSRFFEEKLRGRRGRGKSRFRKSWTRATEFVQPEGIQETNSSGQDAQGLRHDLPGGDAKREKKREIPWLSSLSRYRGISGNIGEYRGMEADRMLRMGWNGWRDALEWDRVELMDERADG